MHVVGIYGVTHSAVVGKMVDKGKNRMGNVVVKAKNDLINWSSVRCMLKKYAMLEAPWARCAMRLAVGFAVEDVSELEFV